MATKKLTTIVIDALEDIKASDIKLINVSKLTSVFDFIAVASADSTRQTKALAKNVMDKVKENGGWIYGIEGEQSGEWVLVDCGDIVVHIMQPAMRELYQLEELWGEGSLEFPKPKPAPKPAVVVAKAAPKLVKAKIVAKKKTAAATAVTKKTAVTTTRKKAPPIPATVKAVVKKTVAKKAVAKKPATKKPVIAKPVTKKAAVKKVVAKKPATAKPAIKKTVVKKVAAKNPTSKKAAVKKPVAKKPVAKKPVAKKPVTARRKAATG